MKWQRERDAEIAANIDPQWCNYNGFCEGKHGEEVAQAILSQSQEE
jgi:hypothetical protein